MALHDTEAGEHACGGGANLQAHLWAQGHFFDAMLAWGVHVQAEAIEKAREVVTDLPSQVHARTPRVAFTQTFIYFDSCHVCGCGVHQQPSSHGHPGPV